MVSPFVPVSCLTPVKRLVNTVACVLLLGICAGLSPSIIRMQWCTLCLLVLRCPVSLVLQAGVVVGVDVLVVVGGLVVDVSLVTVKLTVSVVRWDRWTACTVGLRWGRTCLTAGVVSVGLWLPVGAL